MKKCHLMNLILFIYRPVQHAGIKRRPCMPRKIVERIVSLTNPNKSRRNSFSVRIFLNFITPVI